MRTAALIALTIAKEFASLWFLYLAVWAAVAQDHSEVDRFVDRAAAVRK